MCQTKIVSLSFCCINIVRTFLNHFELNPFQFTQWTIEFRFPSKYLTGNNFSRISHRFDWSTLIAESAQNRCVLCLWQIVSCFPLNNSMNQIASKQISSYPYMLWTVEHSVYISFDSVPIWFVYFTNQLKWGIQFDGIRKKMVYFRFVWHRTCCTFKPSACTRSTETRNVETLTTI